MSLTAFHRHLKQFLIEAFTKNSLSPSSLCEILTQKYRRPCSKTDRVRINQILSERGIRHLVHFTPIQNVIGICRYGLMPRSYLNSEVLRMALGSHFPDRVRADGLPEYSCLSLTSPNYKMFFVKRRENKKLRWAVIIFRAELLAQLWAEYCVTNAATGIPPLHGAGGLKKLFSLPDIRNNLNLAPNEPTDPQAEVLCDNVLVPENILKIYVDSEESRRELSRKNIESSVNPLLFRQRHDYRFWQNRKVTDLPEFNLFMS